MIRTTTTKRVMRLAAAMTIGLIGMMTPMPAVGADGFTVCDYRTEHTLVPSKGGVVGGVTTGAVNINVMERTEITDIDDVTVLVRWVGDGVDLGPAPEGDPVFSTLPADYSVIEPPAVDREETSVDEDESFTQLLGCPQDGDYGENWTGDPADPFSWVTYDDYDVHIELILVQHITRTHNISETRTYQVVRNDDGPGTDGPDADGPDESDESDQLDDTTPSTTTPPDAEMTSEADNTNSNATDTPSLASSDNAETAVLAMNESSTLAPLGSTAGVGSRTAASISFTG